jgi:predicted secreted protein
MLQDDQIPDGLEFLGCRYARAQAVGDRPLVGSGGADSWGFRAVNKGTVHLNLQKVRPWVQPRPKQMDAGFTVNIE